MKGNNGFSTFKGTSYRSREVERRKEIRRLLLEDGGASCFRDYAEETMRRFAEENRRDLQQNKILMKPSQGLFDTWFAFEDDRTYNQIMNLLIRDGKVQESFDEDRKRRALLSAIYGEFRQVLDPTILV